MQNSFWFTTVKIHIYYLLQSVFIMEKNLKLLLVFLCFSFVANSCNKPLSVDIEETEPLPTLIFPVTTEFSLKVEGYMSININSFHILVQEIAAKNSVDQTNLSLEKLYVSLLEIDRFGLDQTIVNELKSVPIFVDWNTKRGGGVYHPSEAWLLENGYIPEKEKAVEICNVSDFNYLTTLNQPYLLLHELAHAYHDRVLDFFNLDILNAYQNTLDKGLHRNVTLFAGNGVFETVPKAYGLNNQIEFFAELTESYFGRNDFFPFNRTELAEYDSVGYAMIEKAWNLNND